MKTTLNSNQKPATAPTEASQAEAPNETPCGEQASPASDAPERGDGMEQKIQRLPKPTRDMINLMLEDGLPYKIILDELGQTAQGLQPQNLVNWVRSGYEDYLNNREAIGEIKTEAEFAADLLKALGGIDLSVIHQAALRIAALQMLKAIREFGSETLRQMLETRPASYISLLNTLCNLSSANLKHQEARLRTAAPAP
jgi:hypothetical protein